MADGFQRDGAHELLLISAGPLYYAAGRRLILTLSRCREPTTKKQANRRRTACGAREFNTIAADFRARDEHIYGLSRCKAEPP